jgi:hypothetical protein
LFICPIGVIWSDPRWFVGAKMEGMDSVMPLWDCGETRRLIGPHPQPEWMTALSTSHKHRYQFPQVFLPLSGLMSHSTLCLYG